MRQIERYLASEIARPVAGTLLAMMVVVLAFYASRTLAEAVADGFTMAVVARLALLRLGMYMDVLIPAALLLGTVIGLGRLQAGNELTAMAALGGGSRRLLAAMAGPVLVLAAVVAAMSMAFRPWAYGTLYRIEAELAVRVDLAQIEPGRFTPLTREWLLFAEQRGQDGLEQVLMHRRDEDSSGVVRAGRLRQQVDADGRHRLVFSDEVQLYQLDATGNSDLLGRFDRLELLFTPPPPPARKKLRRTLPLAELYESDDRMYTAELQWRLLGPLSVLVLALTAIPLSRVDPRRGQSARVLSATLAATLYLSLLGALSNWLERGQIPAWPGIFWLPIGFLALLWLRERLLGRGPGAPP
jgi:lipopolysaccharide export system permease protein